MRKNVLIIDDTKNIRNLLTTCLEIEGFEVTAATDGTEALEILSNKNFNLIFLDIKLPGISGTEILRKIRSMGINTPVIIMTAFATVKNAVDCTKLGAAAYLQKPFTANKIKSVLEEIDLQENTDTNSSCSTSIPNTSDISSSSENIVYSVNSSSTLDDIIGHSSSQTNSRYDLEFSRIANSIVNDSVEAAEKLIEESDHLLCIEILKKLLSDDPANSKVYYLMSVAYKNIDAALSKKFYDISKIFNS